MEIPLHTRLDMRKNPNEIPILYQEWRDLLFLHWEYPIDLIQNSLPPGLYVDTYQGKAYVGVIPFLMDRVSLPGLPSIPGLSHFLEVNLRTYVYDRHGMPGVWFYSLDINSFLATWAARQFFKLPYYQADLRVSKDFAGKIDYSGSRTSEPNSAMHFIYQPRLANTFLAEPGSLEFFLVERYVLFTYARNQLFFEKVHHAPYPLLQVNLEKIESRLFEMNGLEQPQRIADHQIFSYGVNVDIFSRKLVKNQK